MEDNECFYELKSAYNDKVVTIKFNAPITFNDVVDNIQGFLYACGWSEETIKEHIKTHDDMWTEGQKEKKDE